MASYTCISCRVAFADGEVQRAHYKSDWHRYNLKRKVADMPPVTADNFQERVLAQRAAAEQQLASTEAGQLCVTCNKKFSSSNAFQNHLQSHKHQQVEKQAILAAQRKVEKLNEKNLEKGLADEKMDHDSRNEAMQQALKEQQKASPAKQGKAQAPAGESRPRADKPPRVVWFEEQAKRLGEKEEATTQEEEWEDVEEEEAEEEAEEEVKEEEEEEGAMDQEGCGAEQEPMCSQTPMLPGSIPITDCLFCTHHSRSLLRNLAHMTKAHGFFIPDVEFLVDLKGLLCYLGEKVGAGNVCLWCNEKGRSFYSTEAVQGHMTDKSHCRLLTDGDAALEFADFYDFRSSYPDRKEGEHADMEDDLPDDDSLGYDEDTLELTLPSGARIGHRSLMRYYKQRFGVQRSVVLAHNRNAVGRVLRQYKALGWGGDIGKTSFHQTQRDMQYVQQMKSKWMMKMGMNHNATKQNHFRAQVMF